MATIGKTLCSHRWGYPLVDLGKNHVRTCCRTVHVSPPLSQLESTGSDFFLNNTYQKQRRLEMFQGKRHSSCQQCWTMEDNGIQSAREFRLPPNWQHDNEIPLTGHLTGELTSNYFDQNISEDDFIKNTKTGERIQIKNINASSDILNSDTPYMLEVNLSNFCDLQCLYCSPFFSTTWLNKNSDTWLEHVHVSTSGTPSVQELKEELTPRPSQYFEDEFWIWLEKTFKETANKEFRIGIIGGEPLSNPKLPEFLDRLCSMVENIPLEDRPTSCYWHGGERYNIKHKPLLWFVSNLNTNDNYWKKFTDRLPRLCEQFMIEITASCESIGQRAEYIRSGLNWNKFERHVNELAESNYPDMEMGFQASLNALSISGMPNFIRWCKELNEKYARFIMINPSMVTDPSMFNPIILDPSYSKYIEESISMLLEADPYEAQDYPTGRWTTYAEFLTSIRDNIASNMGADNNNWGLGGNRLGSREASMKQLYKFCTTIDNRRKIQFEETFPEMLEFWNECKEVSNR